MWSYVLNFVVQAAATLVGAFTAFKLESRRKQRAERKEQVHSFNRVLFALTQQRTFLLNYENQHLAPNREDKCRAYMLRPLTELPARLDVDVEALTFVLELPQADVLNRIAEADLKYRTLIGVIESRNKLHLQFQERLASAEGIDDRGQDELVVLRRIGGPMIRRQLENLTNHTYAAVSDALTTNRIVYGDVCKACSELFPGEKILRLKEIETTEEQKRLSAEKARFGEPPKS